MGVLLWHTALWSAPDSEFCHGLHGHTALQFATWCSAQVLLVFVLFCTQHTQNHPQKDHTGLFWACMHLGGVPTRVVEGLLPYRCRCSLLVRVLELDLDPCHVLRGFYPVIPLTLISIKILKHSLGYLKESTNALLL